MTHAVVLVSIVAWIAHRLVDLDFGGHYGELHRLSDRRAALGRCRGRFSTAFALRVSGTLGLRLAATPGVDLKRLLGEIPASGNAPDGDACDAEGMALRCLIVDDNASFLEAASTLLEREGVGVVGVASTSADALRQVQELRPDVVLVDVMLGGESGFELARRLAETEARGTRVVLISTQAETDWAALLDDTPAAGFIQKSDLSAGAIRRLVGSV